ncbi:FG-GAP repeat domain-containing protein [Amycolatopsis umgeniensis]|uniref:FG-GAP repeat domain-containing protein n=1 Tax=Amycolatopsis umgeniensis TaxID=336628 RepID=UPI0016172636
MWATGPGTWSVNSSVVGSGDFTGDGKADLLALVDQGNASAGLYVFPGTSARGDNATAPYRVWNTNPGTWSVASSKLAVGDFDADGKADLEVLYDYGNKSAGVWIFPGTASKGDIATVPYRVWWVTPGVFDASLTAVAP